MCLPLKVMRPDLVLSEGTYKGFEWIVTSNEIGSRCGYVRVPAGHPWHGQDYDAVDVRVHGGLTFAAPDMPCDKGETDAAWWFGFDCGHAGDAKDPALITDKKLKEIFCQSPWNHGVIRTTEYVEENCRDLIDQIADVLY